jgi:hypothetical protein
MKAMEKGNEIQKIEDRPASWEDMSIMVIGHDPRWSDTERKQKEKFWMHTG